MYIYISVPIKSVTATPVDRQLIAARVIQQVLPDITKDDYDRYVEVSMTHLQYGQDIPVLTAEVFQLAQSIQIQLAATNMHDHHKSTTIRVYSQKEDLLDGLPPKCLFTYKGKTQEGMLLTVPDGLQR